jgi:hypothetical protein
LITHERRAIRVICERSLIFAATKEGGFVAYHPKALMKEKIEADSNDIRTDLLRAAGEIFF